MLVFSTKLPLKQDVTAERCLTIFKKWLLESPHYTFKEIDYDVTSREDFHTETELQSLSFTHYSDENINLSAGRFENREPHAIWVNDCIFLEEHGVKTMLIQLNCNRLDFSAYLPLAHKPGIVRYAIAEKICRDDDCLPVTDTPILIDDDNIGMCADIMTSKGKNTMPVVYLSRNVHGKTPINPGFLARELSGVAHIFEEKSIAVSFKLKDATDSKNVHSGYAGIYYPGSDLCEKFVLSDYQDFRAMSRAIIDSVFSALVNKIDASMYNWNHIMTLQAKQKMLRWQNEHKAEQQELEAFVDVFDSENKELREKIADLNSKNNALRIQLEGLKEALINGKGKDSFIRKGELTDFYPDEQAELVCNILSQARIRYESSSRPYAILESLIAANKPMNVCAKMMPELKRIMYSGNAMSDRGRAKLRELGFTIQEDRAHYKLIFHDPKYSFTVSKSPSDNLEGKNLYSDINKIIDITKNLF